ncbi:redoxin domain-containing protein [Pseudoxanthomonas sp. SGNA-20]|jgi:Thiol-disulfide isomerase and thioredoxins|uniref:Thiol-disulfide isomerase/thioredoxin n=2 Tax=Lysobacteraceae TaxID=32033 RepID=A0A562D7T4_9GAMM|nr:MULTISPECIES: TlpA disulfide reductase family protein [Pseudoxanthomonas]RRN56453.1 redoxin domain-containing protein [Pseudoxanthomonas sp. SGNA-20]RRN79759.1 redoxin domain-containing protein [Pseudoxanthomonas sp. SGD-10]TWH05181.1 thiol-disulfide isomerase/thioredoxin [Pseudoxanthomonas taiwanensis J19]
MRFPIPALALLALLCACGRQATEPQSAADASPPPSAEELPPPLESPGVVDQTAEYPSFTGTAVDGKPYDLAAQRGRWVVVNFWATWCKPCLQEMPELSALHEMREDIEVVGLAYEDIATEEMQAFLRERPVSYPIVVLDPYAPPGDFATPRGLPMTYLLAPDGKVARQFLGPVSASDIELAVAGKAEG